MSVSAYLDKTSSHHRENTALDRVSVESLSDQHDQEQEITKQAKEDENTVEDDNNNEEGVIPKDEEDIFNVCLYYSGHLNIFLKCGLARSTVVFVSREARSCIRG